MPRTVVPIHIAAKASAVPRVEWQKRSVREYYETHPWPLAATLALALAPPLVGLLVVGLLGSILGLLLGLAASFVVVRTKVRHERFERGGLP